MDQNTQDIHHLYNSPHILVERYQDYIRQIIQYYCRSGYFRQDELDEILQHVNEKVLYKIPKIQQQFNHSVKFKTYFTTIINNICREKIRRLKREPQQRKVFETDAIHDADILSSNKVIQDELDRFGRVLELYYRKKQKLVICLKVLFRIPVTIDDITNYCAELDEFRKFEIVERFNKDSDLSDQKIYNLLTPFLNICEKQNNTQDATRKWIQKQIKDIVKIMNGDPPTRTYQRETLQILVEFFFSSFQK